MLREKGYLKPTYYKCPWFLADLSDSFVFNCKHAFHSECFASKLDGDEELAENYKSTTCPLCHAK